MVPRERQQYPNRWRGDLERFQQQWKGNVLTVINGTGDGKYAPGTQVNLAATAPPSNKVFFAWTGNATVPNTPNTTLTMPNNAVTMTAMYKWASGNDKIRFFPPPGQEQQMLTCVWEGSNGDKDAGPYEIFYQPDQLSGQVPKAGWNDIMVNTKGYRFLRWRQLSGNGVIQELEWYRNGIPLFGPFFGTSGSWGNDPNATWQKAVDGNTSTGFNGPDINTPGWINPYIGVDSRPEAHILTVVNGSGSGLYEPGTTNIPVSANPAPAGQEFDAWIGDAGMLESSSNATTSVRMMPSSDITVTATYRQATGYTLTVTNGTGTNSYPAGAQVPVSANAPPAGQQFAAWIGDTNILPQGDAFQASTTATMPPQNVSLTATYSVSGAATGTGLRGQYYNDASNTNYSSGLPNPFTGSPVLTRNDATVDFDWGGNSPGPGVNADNFSVKWTGLVKAPVSGTYIFSVTGDDGVRLFLNGVKVIDGWKDQGPTKYTCFATLTANTLYNIELHYYEHGAGTECRLRWTPPGQQEQTIPSIYLSPPAGTQVAAPVFNPTPGTYSSAQSVTITSATAGAFIRYTMDGSTPSASVGTLYSGPVPVGSTMTLKAMAFKTGMDDSAVTSGTYTINSVPTYTLTVTNGTGSGSYAQGYQASVSANPPPAGQVFAGWIGNTELLAGQDATRASTTATMTKNASLTATYSTSGGAGTGLQGQYYNDGSGAVYSQSPPLGLANPFTSAPVLTRYDDQVDFNWGANSPGSGVNVNNFSAKWTGRVKALVSGSYIFRVTADDGVCLFFNGVQVIDGWKDQSQTIYTYTTTLTAGTLYNIELHYYEHGDAAVCQLHWIPPGQPDQAIPQSQLYPPSAPAPAGGLVTFEGTGIPTLWVDGSTGNTIDWDYTAAPLVGAQSLFMPDPASGDRWANYNYSEVSDTIYVAFWFRTSALPSAEFPIFEVLDSGNNALASVRLMTNGNVVVRADAVSSASIITMSTNTTYRIKVRYVRGTGANETIQAWCNTNASGAWTSTQTLSNGTSTLQADRASFYNSPNINVNMTIDNVLVKTTDIAWPEIN